MDEPQRNARRPLAKRLRGALGCAAALALVVPGAASAAVYNVSNTNDVAAEDASTGNCATPAASAAGGACTLRSAIQAANNVGEPSTINVAAGTYVLTIAPTGPNDASSGDLNVFTTDKVTINGAGSGTGGTIADGNFTDRVFDLGQDTDVEMTGVRIRNGRTGGLGNVSSCPSGGGGVDANGGGIQTGGALTLTNVVVTGNMTTGNGGGIVASGDHNVTIQSSFVPDNISCAGDSSSHVGGGLAIFGSAGASITIDTTVFSGNVADGTGEGGGAAFVGNNATVANSTFAGNSADSGGGVLVRGGEGATQVDFFADTFNDNSVTGNFSASAIDIGFSDVTVVNSTLASNTGGPAIGASSRGASISYSTLTNAEGNIANLDSGNFTVSNSIVTGSPGANCNGSFSTGHNLFDDDGSECGAIGSDLKSQDPMLGPLADNGGPTETRALRTGSPAIDAGESGECSTTAKSVDQRAVSRPQGPACDIGAYEWQPPDLSLTASAAKSTIQTGEKDTVTDVVTNNGPSTATSVQFTQAADSSIDYTINSVTTSKGTCTHTKKTVSCNLGTLAVGEKVTIKIVLTGNAAGTITLNSSVHGAQQDPNPSNNDATVKITVKSQPPPPPPPPPGCTDKRSFVFKFPHDRQDRTGDHAGQADLDEGHVVVVRVYEDGEHVETFHGRRGKVHVRHFPKKGRHHVRVVVVLDNGFRIVMTRDYNNCTNGPTHVRIIRPRHRDDRP